MSNNSFKNIILLILGLSLLGITVAYASLSTRLNISGRSSVPTTTWDIQFENLSDASPANTTLSEPNTASLNINSIQIDATKIENVVADLKKPGDVAVLAFGIRNTGSIDAKLQTSNSSINCTSQSACSNITYTVSCLDGNNNTVTNGYTLAKNSAINCNLRILYNTNASISDDITATISADWTFIQN